MNAPELTNWIGKILEWIYNGIGGAANAGMLAVAVILFTVLVKTVLLPLDLWQKLAMRKQQRATAAIQPELEKLKKQYANQPAILRQEQYKLQKKSGVRPLRSLLPMLLNMAPFFFVFAGFRAFIRFQNEYQIWELANKYVEVMATPGGVWTWEAAQSVFHLEGFLWIQNIYMPDSWSAIIPTMDAFMGGGMGGIGAVLPSNVVGIKGGYDTIIAPIVTQFSSGEYAGRWNGFMILPVLSIATSFVSSRLMQAQNKKKQKKVVQEGAEETKAPEPGANATKGMMLIMPLISGVFSLLYSAAFAIYMLVSNVFTSIVSLSFNLITGRIDKKRDDAELSNTFRRK